MLVHIFQDQPKLSSFYPEKSCFSVKSVRLFGHWRLSGPVVNRCNPLQFDVLLAKPPHPDISALTHERIRHPQVDGKIWL